MTNPHSLQRYRWITLLVVSISVLIINIDNTILNVALPTLVRQLHATSSELQWVVDSYAMVFAGLLLVAGSLADRLGRKPFFLLGLVVFAIGSTFAAMSGTVHHLIVWRAVMGGGAALLIPASLSIINTVFPNPAERARAIGLWAGTVGLGIAIGPIAGGILLTHFWWGSIFLVNVPIALIGFVGGIVFIPNSRNMHASRPDPLGAILSIVGLGLLLWAIIEAPINGWGSHVVHTVGAASILVLLVFIIWEWQAAHPMLRLDFFRDRRFSFAAAAILFGIFGLIGALFVQTQFFQFDLAYSPLQAGLRILPVAAVLVVAAPLSPLLARKIGNKFTVGLGLTAVAAGLYQISTISASNPSFLSGLPGMLLLGLGAGLTMPTATNSLIGSVPKEESGVGSATNTVGFQLGGALGVAVIGSILSTRYQNHLKFLLAGHRLSIQIMQTVLGSLGGALGVAAKAGGERGNVLAAAARAAFMSGFRLSLIIGSVVAVLGVVLILCFLPNRSRRNH